jgi:hypothetical protein
VIITRPFDKLRVTEEKGLRGREQKFKVQKFRSAKVRRTVVQKCRRAKERIVKKDSSAYTSE